MMNKEINEKPSLDIIIVNWNAGDLLKKCVLSINNSVDNSFKLNNVIIVDNNSTDNSLFKIQNISLPITIIKNKKNMGFGYACNQGARISHSKYILFLNPDTELFENSLKEPINFLEKEENKHVGIVGIQLIDENGSIARNTARFPNSIRFIAQALLLDRAFPFILKPHFQIEWDHKANREVDQIMGAFLMIRRSLFNRLKGFDERFFVYFEDVDLSYRMKKIGYGSYYLATAQAFHKGSGIGQRFLAFRYFYFQKSRILYYFKYFNKVVVWFNIFSILTIEPIVRSLLHISRFRFNTLKEELKAQYWLYKDIKNIVKKGKE